MRYKVVAWIFVIMAILAIACSIYNWRVSRQVVDTTPIIHRDPTTGWQTYTNKQYGFSLKYPLDWTFEFQEDFLNLHKIGATESNTSGLFILMKNQPVSDLVTELLARVEFEAGSPVRSKILSNRNFQLVGTDATEIDYQYHTEGGGPFQTRYIFVKNDVTSFIIGYSPQDIFSEKILPTFKFLNN